MSETTIKIEPNKADPIRTKLWLTPPKILTKCGTIKPTNPIIPDKATLIPTTTAEDIITPKRTFFMFRPSLLASMSPSWIKSNFLDSPIIQIIANNEDLVLLTGNYQNFFGKLFYSNKIKHLAGGAPF